MVQIMNIEKTVSSCSSYVLSRLFLCFVLSLLFSKRPDISVWVGVLNLAVSIPGPSILIFQLVISGRHCELHIYVCGLFVLTYAVLVKYNSFNVVCKKVYLRNEFYFF